MAGRMARWIWPDRAGLRRANRYVIPALILLYPVLGSFNSLAAFMLMGLGILLALSGRAPARFPVEARLVAGALAAFFLAEALSGAVNWRGWPSLREILENATFLGFAPFFLLIVRGRHSLMASIASFAPIAAILALAIGAAQVWTTGIRAQGLAGNPAIFGTAVAVVYAFTLVSVMRRNSFLPTFTNYLGVACAALALLLSSTRALWPVIILFPLVFMAVPAGGVVRSPKRGSVLAIIAALVLATIVVAGVGRDRIGEAISDIAAAGNGEMMTPVGKRLVVWRTAIDAIPEHPLIGFGPDSPALVMAERTARFGGQTIFFSHFHNFVLTEMIRAGALGTICLLAVLLLPLSALRHLNADETAGLAGRALICTLMAFGLGGSTNILFDHDIMDSLFTVAIATLIHLAVPGRRELPK
ncbi:MAG: O-antigen ligase family protein [Nitratireductor sp.]|nr:O-antigen ligase family protein [Nitratireductor sp.]